MGSFHDTVTTRSASLGLQGDEQVLSYLIVTERVNIVGVALPL
jgi:hypothetical protein